MAAKKTSAKKLTKSSFIRSQPPEMSAAEIVAKGKAAGMKISDSLVYMVRGPVGGKATPKKTAAKKTSAKKTAGPKKVSAPKKKATSKATAPKTGESKADFVRARAHLSPKEIVEDAKTKGIKLDPSYVYNVRGYDKATANKKGRASKNGTQSSGSASSVEDLLKAAASELGLGKAIEILEGERARVRSVLGG